MDAIKTNKTPSEWAILRGWILYDGDCGLCSQSARRWRASLLTEGFVFVSSIDEKARLTQRGLPVLKLNEMKLTLIDGRTLGGPRALAEIGRYLWWARPFAWFGRHAVTLPVANWLYRRVANNRHTISRWLGYDACTDACAVRRG